MSELSEILRGDAASGSNNSSLVARLGQWGQKYTDPLAWIFGREYTQPLVDIADFSNKQFSSVMRPFDKVDQTINPLRRYNVVPAANNLKDWVAAKPADAGAIAAGAYFGAGALAGGGAGGGGASGASGGLGSGSGLGSGAGISGAGAEVLPTVTVTGSQGLGGGTQAFLAGGAGGGIGSLANNSGSEVWDRAFSNTTDFSTGMPTSSNPAADIPGIGGRVGGNASSAQGLGNTDYAKLGMNLLNSGQGEQQQQPMMYIDRSRGTPPSTVPVTSPPTGLGRVSNALFPVDPQLAQALGPAYVQQAQNNALLKLGLGLVAAGRQPGATFGGALASGLGYASNDLNGAMQTAYQNARLARADKRADDRESRDIENEKWMREHTAEREAVTDARARGEFDYRAQQNKAELELRRSELEAQRRYREQQQEGIPTTRQTDRGLMQWDPVGKKWDLVPGTEPTGVAGRPIPQGMANDLKSNASVLSQIDQVLPQLRTPDGKSFTTEARNAFGVQNAVTGMLTPDAISDNVKNWVDPKGTDLRAMVTNMNSYIVKERNGAAVTLAEFARQRGFLPTDSDEVDAIEKKLKKLRAAVASEQQYMLDFAESQGYKAPPATIMGTGENLGAPRAGLGAPMVAPNGMEIYPNSQGAPNGVAQRAASYY